MKSVVKIFIVYGGREGEGYAQIINDYFKKKNIGSFLASRQSPDMPAGVDVPSIIDEHLLKSEIAIIIITPELRDSDEAMSEIHQIQHQLMTPYIPYRRRDSDIPPMLLDKQFVEFDPAELNTNELQRLELEMWRSLDFARISIDSIQETQNVEASYLG